MIGYEAKQKRLLVSCGQTAVPPYITTNACIEKWVWRANYGHGQQKIVRAFRASTPLQEILDPPLSSIHIHVHVDVSHFHILKKDQLKYIYITVGTV